MCTEIFFRDVTGEENKIDNGGVKNLPAGKDDISWQL
jgi:hypothetical protein